MPYQRSTLTIKFQVLDRVPRDIQSILLDVAEAYHVSLIVAPQDVYGDIPPSQEVPFAEP